MELYHSAVEILRRAIDDKSTMRSTATATISRNSISSQPPLNAHRLLTVGPSNRILPLTLSSIPTPPQPCVSENPLHASFSYQYYLLNPSVLKTSAETTTAWQAMLAASYNNTATSRPPNSTSTRTEHVGSETITEKSAVLDDGPDEDKKAKQVPGRSQALKRACEDGEEPAVLFDPETYRKMRRLH